MSKDEMRNEARRRVLGVGAMGVAAIALGSMSTLDAEAQPESSAARNNAPAAKLIERDVTFQSGDAQIPAFWAEPTVRPKAAIIIIHEIFGLNPHIRDVARRFARQGYVTLAPDLYSREGTPNVDPTNMDALRKMVAAIPDGRMVGDLQAAVEYLNAEGLPRVGSIGFCMGGLYSYLLACKSSKLNAAVDFYGRIVYAETSANKPESPLDLAPQLKCPLLCNFGEKDASIPVSDIEKLRDKLKQSTQPWSINIYPGAGHAFFNDSRPSYQPEAAADAGMNTLSFLKKYLQSDAV
jgi:carboxymethylenebutenolidase